MTATVESAFGAQRMVRGFMLEPETQPGWLDKMGGKRVAIVPLREGE